MGPKKPKKEEEPDDEFMKMAAPELENNLKLYKEKVSEIKSKRNYIQMEASTLPPIPPVMKTSN